MAQSALKAHLPSLKQHRARLEKTTMRQLFDDFPQRAEHYFASDEDLLFDYSKNRLDETAMGELIKMAQSAGIEDARTRMFSGEKINFTEDRAVLHTALRANEDQKLYVDETDIIPAINQTKQNAFAFAQKVREGEYQPGNQPVNDVVNIGIGGSDLGPLMCAKALAPYNNGPNIHFVSNVDGADFCDTTKGLNPATTLFIVASKSFTTAETMANAALAKEWLCAKLSAQNVNYDIGRHFVALSTNLSATAAFGIDEERIFGFWDWVGGRYSIWSAIGLSLVIGIGVENYQNFLDGARAADNHFLTKKLDDNIPVLMALIGIWHRNVWDYPSHAILPYDNRLSRFPAYLQQLDMESNGKHICNDGKPSTLPTGPLIWGEPGTNGQHAFYQQLHQGTDIIPCDFLIGANSHEDDQTHQKILAANCFAQSRAMMIGRTMDEVAAELQKANGSKNENSRLLPHKIFEGDRPSNTIMYQLLTPYVLGKLIAFYEHKVFVQGIIWGINSFDQWGVELGKQLATQIQPLLESKKSQLAGCGQDSSTIRLIENFQMLSK